MADKFRDIKFPPSYRYSSDSDFIPLEFYEETFSISKTIDLLLGYFSSNAIRVISRSFAEFIYGVGTMRLVTNHIYSQNDYENLLENRATKSSINFTFPTLLKIQKAFKLELFGFRWFYNQKYD